MRLVATAFVFASIGVLAQTPTDEQAAPQVVETFSPPRVTKTVNPYYPRVNQRSGKEGWVTMSYMVDPKGKAYDLTVISSSGDERFEDSAVRAAKRWEHQPAMLDGSAIDAGITMKITFRLSGPTGATRGFSRRQKAVNKAIETKDRVLADDLMSELAERDRNLYEEAFYQVTRYNYALVWGTLGDRYNALSGAAFIDNGKEFLPADALTGVRYNKMAMELQLNYLGQARRTGETLLVRKLDASKLESVQNVIAKIDAAELGDGSLIVEARIGAGNKFSHLLLKSSFGFADVDGDLAEIRLHCDKDYVGFIYSKDTRYNVREDLDNCWMTVIGDPGTQFKLVESSGGLDV